jgi:methanogenic corrinoid protein MtbC1
VDARNDPRNDPRHDHWAALADGDRLRALGAVSRLVAEGWSTDRVAHELVVPSQARVGELWLTGEWSVVQEHCATEVNEAVVHWLTARLGPPADDAPSLLVSCLQGERHALPALVVAHDLMARGARVVFLGADPEPSGLHAAVLALRPSAVLFSASIACCLGHQRSRFDELTSLGVPVVVGGRVFAGPPGGRRASVLGATAHAQTAAEVLDLLPQLPGRTARRPRDPIAVDDEVAWLDHYRHRIVPEVMWTLAQRHHDPEVVGGRWPEVSEHIEHVLGCLSAAISIQDESIMVEVRDWLVEVLVHRDVDPGLVDEVWELLSGWMEGHPVTRLFLAASRATGAETGS